MAKDVKKTQDKNFNKENKKKVIEEVVENKKVVKNKNNSDKLLNVVKTVDDNRKAILFGIVGFLLATLLFRCILWPDRIATLKDGTQPVANVNGEAITANDLYDSLKSNEDNSFNVLLNEIDEKILTEIYPEDNEMIEEVKDMAEEQYTYMEQAGGYTQEMVWKYYGVSSESEFLDYLKLYYRRNKYYDDYVNGLITEKEINKYYDDEVYGDVDSKHILVKIDNESENGLSDEEAKKLSMEIIKELDSGKSWDEVVKKYKDQIVHEELGYNAFNASFEKPYLDECKNLKVGAYSKTPVKTSYGYHVIYKIDQKEKPKLEDVKEDIIEILATEKKNADNKLYHKSLIHMREEAGLEFVDTVFGDEYNEYKKDYK